MIEITSYHGSTPSAENNAKKVSIGNTHFFFSYETLVGVKTETDTKVIKNRWGTTTGKHLNAIDGGSNTAKAARLNQDEFDFFVDSLAISKVIKSNF